LLGSILAACLSTQGSLEEQVQTGVAFYGAAAAYAAKDTTVTGTGTFTAKFIDALSLDRNQLKERKNGYRAYLGGERNDHTVSTSTLTKIFYHGKPRLRESFSANCS